jgi:hypothetical protein
LEESRKNPAPPALLRAHPALQALLDQSETFRRIAEAARLDLDGRTCFIVHGDTLGSREELLVDALFRGSSPESADPLSRALFLELPPALQAMIWSAGRLSP